MTPFLVLTPILGGDPHFWSSEAKVPIWPSVNGGEFCHRRHHAFSAQVGAALPWRCPGAALNFLTGHSIQALQVFFLHCTGIVRGLSPGAALALP